ncbi:3-methylcrotonyl-CoA carboxylase [Alphaproteobacteria bacterium KMM 3653]|uniref:3-methylcrotonyl-CoA carboxylase n=1 Tax=Harenicola maris TaxID=2841044 RepID=A0AAP2CMN4_9RHOB|nr:3-methylcrotonyl-CoA carboxylase [Harenicola maris]
MMRRLLVANRGEIACRVMRTASAMGIETVAVYSDADAGAMHVAQADRAVRIGPAEAAQSYLNGAAILEAAARAGADAIHPGYGFLSENPEFAEAVEAAGLIFVGPSAEAMRLMGLKDAAKARMEAAGVPVVPGYHGSDQDDGRLAAEADAIGYPVLIKAVAGGGGKGMRRVEAASGFAAALASARAEAKAAFGNADVLVEKWVTAPRHIEVQVFGDGERAVHLYERDCSLQRRHQKVIEEAPAPGMTAEVREAMGAAAVRAAEAIGYKGAGTVEFIVDGGGGLRADGFWFMEMNTRLQVEHPVTEAITGVDLVEWQLRVASGAPLPMAQGDIPLQGHAFEARLYAEDVPAGFLPATGTLTHLKFGAGARADTGVRAGDVISPWYDPMIAKVITHGATRAEALSALERALSDTQVAGSVTNVVFLRRLARHAGFAAGEVDTGLIERDIEALSAAPVPCTRCRSLAAIAALGLHEGAQGGFALWEPIWHPVAMVSGGEEIAARVAVTPEGFSVRLGEVEHRVSRDGAGWRVDGIRVPAQIFAGPGEVCIYWGNTYVFAVPDPLNAQGAGAAGDAVVAPMPGLVRQVLVAVGDTVEAGDPLALLEAMKMEHTLTAPRAGVVARVAAQDGDQVEAGVELIGLEAGA